MTRGQRRAHKLAWLVLVPLLAAVIGFALVRRAQTHAVFFHPEARQP